MPAGCLPSDCWDCTYTTPRPGPGQHRRQVECKRTFTSTAEAARQTWWRTWRRFVGWRRRHQVPRRGCERLQRDAQDLGRAATQNHAARGHGVKAGERRRQRCGFVVRVALDDRERAADGVEHTRPRPVWIFVGVELNDRAVGSSARPQLTERFVPASRHDAPVRQRRGAAPSERSDELATRYRHFPRSIASGAAASAPRAEERALLNGNPLHSRNPNPSSATGPVTTAPVINAAPTNSPTTPT